MGWEFNATRGKVGISEAHHPPTVLWPVVGLGPHGSGGSQYDRVLALDLPTSEQALPLGETSQSSHKRKNPEGGVCGHFPLLFWELEKKDKEDLDERDEAYQVSHG